MQTPLPLILQQIKLHIRIRHLQCLGLILHQFSNCDVFINTNENPVQLKTCENCEVIKLNTNTKTIHKLVTNPISIFISSDNKFDAVVDFIYIPKN